MVKKVDEFWINIYRVDLKYLTEEEADLSADSDRLGKACFVRHEYEVEE
jgi:hypothetical protein